MNSPNSRVEKRHSPRIKRRVSLKVKFADYDLVGQTHNISCIGAYCTVNKHIPPLSKISIIMLLPLKIGNRDSICNVRCRGEVVRVEQNPIDTKEHNIAIYFDRIRPSDKATLSEYIQQHL